MVHSKLDNAHVGEDYDNPVDQKSKYNYNEKLIGPSNQLK